MRQGKVSYQISKYQLFFNIFFEKKIERLSLKSSLPAAKNAAQYGIDKKNFHLGGSPGACFFVKG